MNYTRGSRNFQGRSNVLIALSTPPPPTLICMKLISMTKTCAIWIDLFKNCHCHCFPLHSDLSPLQLERFFVIQIKTSVSGGTVFFVHLYVTFGRLPNPIGNLNTQREIGCEFVRMVHKKMLENRSMDEIQNVHNCKLIH